MDKESLIQKYLHNELVEQETILFNKLLIEDIEFAEEVELRSIFYAERNSKLKKVLERELTENQTSNTKVSGKKSSSNNRGKSLLRFITFLAVCLILLLVIRYFNNSGEKKNLVDIYLAEKHDPPPVMMDFSNQKENNWNLIIKAYQNENFEVVSEKIRELLKTDNNNKKYKFYLGLSLLYSDPPEYLKSIQLFEELIENDDNYRFDEALWYCSLAKIKINNKPSASKYLELISDKKLWNYQRAIKLLEEKE